MRRLRCGIVFALLFALSPACFGSVASVTDGTVGVPGEFALVGDGWDGPGLGSAALTYHFGALTPDLADATTKATLVAAMSEWAAVSDLTFTETLIPGLPSSIDISFGAGAHGDGFPFDGPGGVLAHAFFPSPPNPESIAGDMHFDDAELWEVGNGLGGAAFDLMWVAVHELGHALGLGHSTDSSAVMFPSVSAHTVYGGLHADDIAGIQALYSFTSDVPEPTTLAIWGIFGGLGIIAARRRRKVA